MWGWDDYELYKCEQDATCDVATFWDDDDEEAMKMLRKKVMRKGIQNPLQFA